MSWLSHFIDKLFGRNRSSAPASQTAAGSRPAGQQSQPARKSTMMPENFREQTLGWLLQQSPTRSPGTVGYDLSNPPSIDKAVLDGLRQRIDRIPPMPEIWHQVQDILAQPGASASDLGQCISQDPVLTAQILKICNSSAYASHGSAEVTNIPLAIARLGLDEAGTIIFRTLAPELGGSEKQRQQIRHVWFHSQATAALSRILQEPSHKLLRHEATLTGMLHDIGKLVILHLESVQSLDQLKSAIDQGADSLTAEHETLGYTHIDAGMMLALHWGLPRHVQQLIARHHHPAAFKADHLPESLRQAMMTLHTAHLMLQQLMAAEENHGSIWQAHRRTCMQDTLRFVQHEMLIPLESEAMFSQMQAEVARLKLSFPDLFPSVSQ